jgi:hypothetical protein
LRDLLIRYGFSPDEPLALKFIFDEELLSTSEIPSTKTRSFLNPVEKSLRDAIGEFIDKAEALFSISETIPPPFEGKVFKIVIEGKSPDELGLLPHTEEIALVWRRCPIGCCT